MMTLTNLLKITMAALFAIVLSGAQMTGDAAAHDMNLNQKLSTPAPVATLQLASHAGLCGVGLGGRCPRIYRGCRRAGGSEAKCRARANACSSCADSFAKCRQSVGHMPFFWRSCRSCRWRLNACLQFHGFGGLNPNQL